MTRSSGAGRHDLSRVPDPAAGLPGDMPTSVNNTQRALGIVAINDAYDPQRRVRAVARYDLLDRERHSGNLDEAAFQMGRTVERVFERMSRVSGAGQWAVGDRLDGATQAQVAAALGFENALKVNAFLNFLLRHLGPMDTRLLWMILGDRLTFQTAAIAFGRSGVRGVRGTVDRFREALAALAEVKAARGRALR